MTFNDFHFFLYKRLIYMLEPSFHWKTQLFLPHARDRATPRQMTSTEPPNSSCLGIPQMSDRNGHLLVLVIDSQHLIEGAVVHNEERQYISETWTLTQRQGLQVLTWKSATS